MIENRTGGGTVIAATAVAKSPPDGYTLFFVPAGTLTTNATLYKKLPYDPGKDFVPIALTSKLGFVLVVNPSLPVHSMKELVAYVKERPGQLSFGSTGIGATPHLAFEMFQRAAGLKMTHVPYRGMPQAVNDVVGNHVQMVFADPAVRAAADRRRQAAPARGVVAGAHHRSCRTCRRCEEAGFKGFEAVSWHMIVGAGGHAEADRRPPARRIQAHRGVAGIQAAGLKMGLNAIDSPPPDELKQYLDTEIARWGELVKQVGIAGTQ